MSSTKPPRARPGAAPPPKRKRSNRRLLAIGAPIAAIAIFAAVIIAVHLATSSDDAKAPDASNLLYVPNAKSEFAGIPSKGNVVGFADAPVTVEEYGDLRCPVCREFDSTVIPDVIDKLVRTHKVKILYRHWPILGPNSEYAGRAAYAAEKQNKLWEYALVVYYNQGDETQNWFTKNFADSVATAVGLNLAQFDKDFNDTSAVNDQAQATDKAAAQLNFQGTPSVLVVGAKKTDDLGGVTPTYEDIAKAVTKVSAA